MTTTSTPKAGPDGRVHMLCGDLQQGEYLHVILGSERTTTYVVTRSGARLLFVQPRPAAGRGPAVFACYNETLRAFADHRAVGSMPLPQGPILAAVYHGPGATKILAQALPALHVTDGFMRETVGGTDMWKIQSGSWHTRVTAKDKNATPNPFVLTHTPPAAGEEALLLGGRRYWGHLRLAIACRRVDEADVGLVFGYDKGWGFRLSVSGPPAQAQLRLERVTPKGIELLGRKAFGCPRWFRLGAEVRAEGTIHGQIDGQTLVDVHTADCPIGRVGLSVKRGKVFLDDFALSDLTQEAQPMASVLQQSLVYSKKARYAKDNRDDQLERWAQAADLWQPHQVVYQGQMLRGVRNRILLFNDFRVIHTPQEDSVLALLSPTQTVVHAFACPAHQPLVLQRQGEAILWQGKRVHRAPAGSGLEVGFYAAATPGEPYPDILSRTVWHEFFEVAPVGWLPVAGKWTMANRWSCKRKWNWYQGLGLGAVINISKHRFDGNQMHEYYYGMKDIFERQYVKSPGEKARRYARHDVNFSFCTNGRDVSSGYTVLFGAYDNKATYLLKQDKVLATNREVKFERFENIWDLHLYWRRFRIEKIDTCIRVFLDDRRIFEVQDPQPLQGGHVALWTWRNGVVYGLVRTSAEKRANASQLFLQPRAAVPEGDWQPMTPEHVACTAIRDGRLRIENRFGGGHFAVRYKLVKPKDLAQTPVIVFPFRPGPGTCVNLHVRISGTAFVIPLTAPLDETYAVLGQRPATEAEWRAYAASPLHGPAVTGFSAYKQNEATVRVDLLAEMEQRFGTRSFTQLESLIIGNTSNKDYLLAGFHGNRSGCFYEVGPVRFVRGK